MAMAGMFAAIMIVMSQLAIPLPATPVPLTLSLAAVYMIATVLPLRLAAMAQIAYLLLGAAGLPVFAGFKGGAAVLLGPTGGFLMAYVPMTLAVGLAARLIGGSPAPPRGAGAIGAAAETGGAAAGTGNAMAGAVGDSSGSSGRGDGSPGTGAGAASSRHNGDGATKASDDSGSWRGGGAPAPPRGAGTAAEAMYPSRAMARAAAAVAHHAAYALSYLLALAICYALGTAWLMAYSGMALSSAAAAAVLPFIPLDLVKIAACAAIAPTVRRSLGAALPAGAGPNAGTARH
jgi:biotin transporter BioY